MSLKAGDNIKWTHPETGEVYYFYVAALESFRGQHTITLKDGRKFDVWEHEVGDTEIEISNDQINPTDFETKFGALML